MAPDRTIAHAQMEGRKKDKTRLTYLVCANGDGTENYPLMVIGNYFRPRPSNRKTGQQLGFDYWNNAKAWMNCVLFFAWLHRFDKYIGETAGRKVILLIDNCSAHGKPDNLPVLENVTVRFLPPNATANFQHMDAGIIASFKKKYMKMQYNLVLDCIESDEKNIYNATS